MKFRPYTKEEFKKEYPVVLYRGAKTEAGLSGNWWTPSKRYAKHYSHGYGHVKMGRTKPLKLLNLDTKRDYSIYKDIKFGAETSEEIAKKVVEAGYDGTSMFRGSEIHIHNPEKLPLGLEEGSV